jgi:hypothetical protein
MNTTALEVAISKARSLPDAAREQIGRDVLLRIERLEKLRGDLRCATLSRSSKILMPFITVRSRKRRLLLQFTEE